MPGSFHSDDLDKVYGAKTPEESRAAYDAWAPAYDTENLEKGFRLPGAGAGYVARFVGVDAGPLLDAACGTGLVGEALKVLGFPEIVGNDLSPEMLGMAERTGAYAKLYEQKLGEPLPEADGTYAGACIFGAFGPGHAPPESLDELARVVRPGGHVLFNVPDEAFESRGFPRAIAGLEQSGRWRKAVWSPRFRPFLIAEPEMFNRIFVYEVLA